MSELEYTSSLKLRQQARYELGRLLAEQEEQNEKNLKHQIRETKDMMTKSDYVFANTRKMRLQEQMATDSRNYRNTVNGIITNIIKEALGDQGASLSEEQVYTAVENFKSQVKVILKEDQDVGALTMPMMSHTHHKHMNIGQKADTLERLIKTTAMSHTVALKHSSAQNTPDNVGIINAYNRIDMHIATGQNATTEINSVHANGINLTEENTKNAIRVLCESVAPEFRNRVLKALGEEKKRQSQLVENEYLAKQALIEGQGNTIELEAAVNRANRAKLMAKKTLFQECFMLTQVLNEHQNPTKDELLNETFFNVVTLEVLNECGFLKEGIDVVASLSRIRQNILRNRNR